MINPILRIAEIKDFSKKVINTLKVYFEVDTTPVNKENLHSVFQSCDVFWFRLGYKIDQQLLHQNQRCKVLATPVTGIDHIDEQLCTQYGIRIIYLKGEVEFLKEVRATAEHTILITLALMRQLYKAVEDVLHLNWRRDLFRGNELYRKKVGIIGYGRLGSIVGSYFRIMGCNIHAYDINEREYPNYIQQETSIRTLIKNCDVITLHIPYNEKNHHFINRELFKLFTPNKILINTSRGGVINEKALLEVLEMKSIGGVALDVLEREPDIRNNPLVLLASVQNNILITPHIGGNTYESFQKTEEFLAQKVISHFK